MLESDANIFVRKSIGDYERDEPLSGDASVRKYSRIYKNGASYILCEDAPSRNVPDGEYPYKIIYDIFRKENIPVPEVLSRDAESGLLLIDDLGDDLLLSVLSGLSPDKKREIYERLIDIMIKIQRIRRVEGLPPFQLSFDVEKLMYEFDFFIDNALCGYFGTDPCLGSVGELRSEFFKISKILFRPDIFVLNHRDFHSRNVMIFNGSPYIIDFQDARLGLPMYDPASLLRDSYLRLDEDTFTGLKKYYYARSLEAGVHRMSADEFDYYFDLMAFQRNIKAVGTFGYQSVKLKRERYAAHISPTLSYISGYVERRKELKRAGELLQSLIEVGP